MGTNQLKPGNGDWKLALAKACMSMIGVLCRFEGGSANVVFKKDGRPEDEPHLHLMRKNFRSTFLPPKVLTMLASIKVP